MSDGKKMVEDVEMTPVNEAQLMSEEVDEMLEEYR